MHRTVKITVISILSVIAFLILATLVVSYIVGDVLTHPTRRPVVGNPGDVRLAYKNVNFPSRKDAVKLSGWLIPAGKPDKIVIEAHGYRENRSKDEPALPTAKALHDAGVAVLMFDFRDEGASQGKEVSVGEFEERDLLGAIDYAQSLGYKNIGLLGFSMGASIALNATADDASIEATVADSPFANLKTYLQGNMSVWTHLPKFPFTPEIFWEMRTFFGLDPATVDPLDKLQHAKKRPILLIAGTADDKVPMQNSEMLYQELKSDPDDALWIVPGANHVKAYSVEPQQYEQRVVSFFTKYLK